MGAAMTLQVRQFEIEARMIACRLQATTPAICDGRLLRVDCCSRRGRGSNASYEASSHKFFAPIDDKTILTAICLIRLFLERREPRIGLVVEGGFKAEMQQRVNERKLRLSKRLRAYVRRPRRGSKLRYRCEGAKNNAG